MTLRHVLSLVLVLGSAACRSPPDMDLEEQWGDTMRRLAMFGFHPMSENVQIGDLYLHAPPADPSRRSVARFSLLHSFSPAGLERIFGIPAGAASAAGPAPRPGESAGHAIRINRAGGIFDAP
jgi:hypothetical protein